MERKIEEVSTIAIDEDMIRIHHGTIVPETFRRDKWTLIVEDILRLEDNRRDRKPSTLIGVRGGIGVSCQILEDKKFILCGERPEKMFID